MQPTLRRLLGVRGFRLSLLHPTERVDTALSWVSSSDLPDPTPFLRDGQLVLTTGLQFASFSAREDYFDYVRRLDAAGVVGVGFGTEVITAGTPDALLEACRALDMPLIEVPYDVPFVALITWTAREIAREAAARDEWALAAQQAISLAAVSPDGGASAVLRETAKQLGGAVLLFDQGGALVEQHPPRRLPDVVAEHVHDDVVRLLQGRRRASAARRMGEREVIVQTLGPGDTPLGAVACVVATPMDVRARSVMTTGVSLIEAATGREAREWSALAAIAGHALRLLEHGEPDLAAELFADVPRTVDLGAFAADAEVVVAVCEPGADADEARRALHRALPGGARVRLAGFLRGRLVALTDIEHAASLTTAVGRLGMRAGVSSPHPLRSFPQALAEAEAAFAAARGAPGANEWSRTAGGRILTALAESGWQASMRPRLQPVLSLPEGDELLRLAAGWFEHGCRWDAAARAAGMHRHSLRGRIERLAALLELDLHSFADRAEMWALVCAAGADGGRARVRRGGDGG